MQHIIFFIVLAYAIVPGSRGKGEDDANNNTNLEEEISILKSLLLEVNSRLQNVEIKNQALENENIRLKSQFEDINEDLRHHVTSSDIHFGVIEENFDNHVTSSEINFAAISDRIDQNKNTTDQNLREHVEISESHFLEIDNTLSPIGTITAWVPKVGLEDGQISEIPPCWMACDGSTIPNGLWAGRNTPNLNGEGRFLRGGPIENSLLTQEDSIQSHTHSINVS